MKSDDDDEGSEDMDPQNNDDWLDGKWPDEDQYSEESQGYDEYEDDNEDDENDSQKNTMALFEQNFQAFCHHRISMIERNSMKEWQSAEEMEKITEEEGRRTTIRAKRTTCGREQHNEKVIGANIADPTHSIKLPLPMSSANSATFAQPVVSLMDICSDPAFQEKSSEISDPIQKIIRSSSIKSGDQIRRFSLVKTSRTTVTTTVEETTQMVDIDEFTSPQKNAKPPQCDSNMSVSKINMNDLRIDDLTPRKSRKIRQSEIKIQTPKKRGSSGITKVRASQFKEALLDATLSANNGALCVLVDDIAVTPLKAICGPNDDMLFSARKSIQKPRLVRM